ncbi:MAG: hypothetical protein V1911_03775, partial [Candidatus Micrarchaeota archaeon]
MTSRQKRRHVIESKIPDWARGKEHLLTLPPTDPRRAKYEQTVQPIAERKSFAQQRAEELRMQVQKNIAEKEQKE